jgi:hypothetical protein
MNYSTQSPHILWVLTALCFLCLSAQETGCRRKAANNAMSGEIAARSADFLVKKLRAQVHPNVKHLNAQAKVFVEGEGQSFSATANIIWVRDSVIWLNIKKFGIEAARALVTQDSVFVINRLEKEYSASGLESLQRTYSLPGGFDLLQQILLAEAWLEPEASFVADVREGTHRLASEGGQFSADYRLEDASFLLRRETFLQPKNAQTVSLSFEKHKKTPLAGWFPYLRRVEAFSPETGNVRLEIELSDVEINVPKTFRFEVPSHYQRTE